MNINELKKFFSIFFKIPESSVNENLKLDSTSIPNMDSLMFYQLISDIETHFNVKIKDINSIITFGDLIKSLSL